MNPLKCFSVRGRASRQQYWAIGAIGTFFVFLFPVYFVLGGVIALIFQEFNLLWGVEHVKIFGFATIFIFEILLAFLFLLVSVRRCRDARISLWWLLLWLVPFVNIVFLIVLGCLRSSDARGSHATPCAQRKK